jgi:hypothetical protein
MNIKKIIIYSTLATVLVVVGYYPFRVLLYFGFVYYTDFWRPKPIEFDFAGGKDAHFKLKINRGCKHIFGVSFESKIKASDSLERIDLTERIFLKNIVDDVFGPMAKKKPINFGVEIKDSDKKTLFYKDNIDGDFSGFGNVKSIHYMAGWEYLPPGEYDVYIHINSISDSLDLDKGFSTNFFTHYRSDGACKW